MKIDVCTHTQVFIQALEIYIYGNLACDERDILKITGAKMNF